MEILCVQLCVFDVPHLHHHSQHYHSARASCSWKRWKRKSAWNTNSLEQNVKIENILSAFIVLTYFHCGLYCEGIYVERSKWKQPNRWPKSLYQTTWGKFQGCQHHLQQETEDKLKFPVFKCYMSYTVMYTLVLEFYKVCQNIKSQRCRIGYFHRACTLTNHCSPLL